VRPAFGERGAPAVAALVRRDLPRRTVRYYVAEDDDGHVVGSARLAIAQELGGGGLRPLVDAIGWPAALRGAFVLGLLTHARLAPGEAYVEELVVREDRRRCGIGRALLAACEDEAAAAGKTSTTLWVAEHNDAAVALYRDAGYRVRRRRATLRGRVLFGAPAALLMERPLERRSLPDGAILPPDAADARTDTP
jgi:ribosomal protein S18 acetylase RimI-like enzyme